MIAKLNNNKMAKQLFSKTAARLTITGVAGALGLNVTIDNALAAVIGIEAINTAGPVEITNQFFIPGDNPEAHFFLPTGVFEEDIFNIGGTSGGREGIAWWDLEIKVTRTAAQIGQNETISIDKVVTNQEPWKWDDFHLTLGKGIGDDFEESNDIDELHFNLDPNSPVETNGFFKNPPMNDPDKILTSNNLWWFGPPGLAQNQTANFWTEIQVPNGLFDQENETVATFTIRQHATVSTPEPVTVLGLLAVGSLGLGLKRKKQS